MVSNNVIYIINMYIMYIRWYIDLARRELRVVVRREIRGLIMELKLEMKLDRILEMWVENIFSSFFVDSAYDLYFRGV